MSRHSVEQLVAPVVAGVLVLVTLLALIGTAIRDPRPRDIAVGVVGPAPAVSQVTGALSAKAPGVFAFTSYDSEDAARSALDSRTIDGAVLLGQTPRIIVAGAAGDANTGVITTVFGAALASQAGGGPVPVEVVHPFAGGDAHGLVLFFLVLATLISTLVVGVGLLVRARERGVAAWLGVTAVWALVAAAAGALVVDWISDWPYDAAGIVSVAALLALASLAVGTVIGGAARLLGLPGLGLAALIAVLLDLVSSGGPAGSNFLPDAYRWMGPWMPAGQLYSALRGALYFGGQGVGTPQLVLVGWLAAGLLLMTIAAGLTRRAPKPVVAPAH